MVHDDVRRREQIQRARIFLNRVVHATGDQAVQNMMRLIDQSMQSTQKPDQCLSSKWILSLLLAVQNVMCGAIKEGVRELFLDLRATGRNLPFQLQDIFNVDQLGESFLKLIVWEPWPCSANQSVPRLRSMIRLVYSALPRCIRPSLKVYRHYLVRACLRDIERAEKNGEATFVLRMLPVVFAPGRILNRW